MSPFPSPPSPTSSASFPLLPSCFLQFFAPLHRPPYLFIPLRLGSPIHIIWRRFPDPSLSHPTGVRCSSGLLFPVSCPFLPSTSSFHVFAQSPGISLWTEFPRGPARSFSFSFPHAPPPFLNHRAVLEAVPPGPVPR